MRRRNSDWLPGDEEGYHEVKRHRRSFTAPPVRPWGFGAGILLAGTCLCPCAFSSFFVGRGFSGIDKPPKKSFEQRAADSVKAAEYETNAAAGLNPRTGEPLFRADDLEPKFNDSRDSNAFWQNMTDGQKSDFDKAREHLRKMRTGEK